MATKDQRNAQKAQQASEEKSSTTIPLSQSQLPSNPSGLASGAVLGHRFRILRLLGSGGMGEVYEAEDLELGQKVALKTLHTTFADDDSAAQRFQREIITARRVTHEGVCRTFDFFRHSEGDTESSTTFLTMELLPGETLADHLASQGPFEPEQALPLVRQMIQALGAAHRAGVIHRDFKSSNVMLVPAGEELRAVITDFGLARGTRPEDREASMTRTHQLVGSPAYIAPEQVEGLEVTPRTDIYSFGVVLYEMFTGHRPFEDENVMAMMVRRATEDPPPPSHHRPELSPRWDTLVMRCLARNPQERFASAEELLEALEAPLPPTSKRWPSFLAVAALLTLTLTVSWFFEPGGWSHTEALDRTSIAVLPLHNRSPQVETDWLGLTLTEMLTSELGMAGDLRTISGELVTRMERDLEPPSTDSLAPDTLRRIRNYLNTDLVMLGSYFQADATQDNLLRLDLRIQDAASGETLATLSETFSENQLLQLVPQVGQRVRTQLGLDRPMPPKAHKTMPATPQAARLYAEGLENLRQYELIEAQKLLEKAVQADPEYSLGHLALGDVLWSRGNRTRAQEQFEQAYQRSEYLPREEQLFVEARYYESMADWAPAIERFQALVEFYPDEADYCISLARALRQAGRGPEGLEVLERLVGHGTTSHQDPRIDLERSEIYYHISEYKAARDIAIATRKRAETMGARYLEAQALHLEARAWWNLGELETAEQLTAQVLERFQALDDLRGIATASNLAAILAGEMAQLDKAWDLYQQSLEAFQQLGHISGQETLLNNLGTISQQRNDLEQARDFYRRGLALARELSNQYAIATYLTNLGALDQDQGQLEQALHHALEALELTRAIQDRKQEISVHILLASLHRYRGHLTASEQEVEHARALLEPDDNPRHEASILTEEYQNSYLQGDLRTSRQLTEKALAIHRGISGERRTAAYRYQLVKLDFEEGKIGKARKRLQDIVRDLRQWDQTNDEALAHFLLAEIEFLAGNDPVARQALEEGLALWSDTPHYTGRIQLRVLKLWAESTIPGREPDLVQLRDIESQLEERGYLPLMLEVRTVRGLLELRQASTTAGRKTLLEVERQARDSGLEILARGTRRILDENPLPTD